MKNSFLSLKLLFRLNIFLEEVWLELNPGNSLLQSLKFFILDSLAQDQGVFAGWGRTVAPTVLAPFMRIWAGIAAAERHFRLSDAIVDCRVDSNTVSANNYESFRLYLRNKFW